MIIQLLALFYLGILSIHDIKSRKIPVLRFLEGALITVAVGAVQEGWIFMIYMAIFGSLFFLGAALGARWKAWYWGEALAMPILAAGTYSLHMLWFFIFFITLIPGTAWALRRSDLYQDRDEPLLPAFFLVLLLAWIFSILL